MFEKSITNGSFHIISFRKLMLTVGHAMASITLAGAESLLLIMPYNGIYFIINKSARVLNYNCARNVGQYEKCMRIFLSLSLTLTLPLSLSGWYVDWMLHHSQRVPWEIQELSKRKFQTSTSLNDIKSSFSLHRCASQPTSASKLSVSMFQFCNKLCKIVIELMASYR